MPQERGHNRDAIFLTVMTDGYTQWCAVAIHSLSMIFSENRCPLFGIMLYSSGSVVNCSG